MKRDKVKWLKRYLKELQDCDTWQEHRDVHARYVSDLIKEFEQQDRELADAARAILAEEMEQR